MGYDSAYPSNIELQRKRSGLSSGSLKFSHVVFISSSSTASRACSGSRRWDRVFRAVHFHFRHHVFCSVSAAEKTATGTATLGVELENRGSSRDQFRNSRVDRKREGDNRDVEGGRSRTGRDGRS